ncbi:hypothetical protein [Bradyrhizobium sp. SZCCHNRI1073]|uniref:hypothetical protein n=1 Tax=Bradyrhizobium sp. SZCCHNRI1073 TaxID=3057280 RepID=UPI00291668EA|nr:hypothetical protein [Bradyrhizobium sp. SZCCHNRI1073]
MDLKYGWNGPKGRRWNGAHQDWEPVEMEHEAANSIGAEQLMQHILDKAGGVCCLKCARAILAEFNVTPKIP